MHLSLKEHATDRPESAPALKSASAPDPTWAQRALEGISNTPFWLDFPDAPLPAPPLTGSTTCDLVVVGAGYTGLWTAVLAKERDLSRDVVLLEAGRLGWQASGRNGGFCMPTLTHGIANNVARWPREVARLSTVGLQNLAEMRADVEHLGIDCDWRDSGEMDVAVEPWQIEHMAIEKEQAEAAGFRMRYLDREAVRAEVDSPRFLAGLWRLDGAMLDPARLAWGLARAARDRGVRIHEGSPVTALRRSGEGVLLETPAGEVRARRVMLATNAFPSLLRRLRPYTIPVYDYALMTAPLDAAQLSGIGWQSRMGLADAGLFFHYFRISADDRILWGGWDGIYHWRSRVRPEYAQRRKTFELLARQFFATFPQLEGLRFTHGWGGAIDVCSSLSPFFGTALGGRVAYALGYTGQGVCLARLGANVCLDLLAAQRTERTGLPLVGRKPVPWPPEPLRSGAIRLTQRSMRRTHELDGYEDAWLRTLGRLHVGFDT